jgi:hypothetical protein
MIDTEFGTEKAANYYTTTKSTVKPTLTGLEIKISIAQKVRQHENFKSTKKEIEVTVIAPEYTQDIPPKSVDSGNSKGHFF